MSSSPSGHLVYGFHLGSGGDWQIKEKTGDEFWSQLDLPWYDAEAEDSPRFPEALSDRIDEVKAKEIAPGLDLVFGGDCQWDENDLYLVIHEIIAYDGGPKTVDPAWMDREPWAQEWQTKLKAACARIGITPIDEHPAWFLVSSYG
jgi:hypothetical protein